MIDECAYEGNIDQGWGNITGEEMVRRFWEGTVRGGYVGHGETYLTTPRTSGGPRAGSCAAPARTGSGSSAASWRQPRAATSSRCPARLGRPQRRHRGPVRLIYFGFNQPTYRRSILPPGDRFHVDVIDTWNMTIETLPETFEGRFRIELPGRQYVAVRLVAATTG